MSDQSRDEFPAAKADDEIALIVAELGEELGVWTEPEAADDSLELIEGSAVQRLDSVVELIEGSAVQRLDSVVELIEGSAVQRLDSIVDAELIEGSAVTPIESIDEDVELIEGSAVTPIESFEDGLELLTGSAIKALEPGELTAEVDSPPMPVDDLDEDPDDTREYVHGVCFGELLDNMMDDAVTIEPVKLDGLPPRQRPAKPLPQPTWSDFEEDIATDMFVA